MEDAVGRLRAKRCDLVIKTFEGAGGAAGGGLVAGAGGGAGHVVLGLLGLLLYPRV